MPARTRIRREEERTRILSPAPYLAAVAFLAAVVASLICCIADAVDVRTSPSFVSYAFRASVTTFLTASTVTMAGEHEGGKADPTQERPC